MFYSVIKETMYILQTIPATTCTTEKSFSTLHRVKKWLRSAMGTQRLSSLCMLSIRKNLIEKDRHTFLNRVINKCALDSRR